MSHHSRNYYNSQSFYPGNIGNVTFGLAPLLLLPLLFTNNRRNVNIININSRRDRNDYR